MDEKELKTSPKQRFFIILIAVLMLGSIIAGYVAIIFNNGKSDSDVDNAKIAEYQAAYDEISNKVSEASSKYYDKLINYKSEVKAYNEASANEGGVVSKDLSAGTGRTLTENDSDYLAYYIGWCSDETVFDSSFDDYENPTKLKPFIDLSSSQLIEGWYSGMKGAKIGGVREITIPSDLAYGEGEICDGTNKPIKFIVLTVAREGEMAELADELSLASNRLQYAYYGMDYDKDAGAEETIEENATTEE
ncbi:FKBP-type peptidyl-prolyl cis-trans isomerase [Candidatus Saccharibacteria bacterium]|nr:FKBP-type peptidyl-prolyl cis-trans isomerase [Candidatus Saccharibacteria bacterium]